MHPKLFTLICVAVLAAYPGTWAQDTKETPPPVPPFVAAVPANADWTVTVQKPAASALPKASVEGAVHPDRRIIEVHSTKTGKFKRDRITSADGVIEERWFVDSLLLWPTKTGEVAVTDLSSTPSSPSDTEDTGPSVASGFPGVAWIRLEYYDRPVLVEQRPYYHYVHGSAEAWIDVESRLPLAYKTENSAWRFKFNAPPDAPLTMPPSYQKALDIVEKAAAYRRQVQKDLGRKR